MPTKIYPQGPKIKITFGFFKTNTSLFLLQKGARPVQNACSSALPLRLFLRQKSFFSFSLSSLPSLLLPIYYHTILFVISDSFGV